MNTFGKTLAVLNLVVALATLAFFAAIHGRQVNWKKQNDELRDELAVVRANIATKDPEISSQVQHAKVADNTLQRQVKNSIDEKNKYDKDLADEKALTEAAELGKTTAELGKLEAEEAKRRLQIEVDALGKSLQRSEADKQGLQDRINNYIKEVVLAKNETEKVVRKLEQLADQLRDKQKEMDAVLAANRGPAGGLTKIEFGPKAGNDPNPPPVKVKGQVTSVSRDRGDGAGVMVELNVGADQGVGKFHTLDVYRVEPQPDYLGMIRILNVTERTSVGRLMSTTRGAPIALRAGDIVVDKLGD